MPAGANAKREAEYRKLTQRFRQERRYAEREQEVAARIVNKQRAQYGETKEEKRNARQGRAPDRGLPIAGYRTLTVPEIRARLDGLTKTDLETLRAYEGRHKKRKGVLGALEARLK